jgi:CCR4-NOT transcription complex subunit 1
VNSVSAIFEFPLKHCPEVLILSLVETQVMKEAVAASTPPRPKPKIEFEWHLFSILMSSFLTTNQRSAAQVLRALWATHPSLVVRGMADVYQAQPSQITRLFDIAQELKGLRRVLDTAPILFSMDMATLAWRRGYLNLDSWLLQNISTHQRPFVAACVRYLVDRSGPDSANAETSSSSGFSISNHLTNDARGVILKVLQNCTSLMPPQVADDFKKLTSRYAHLISPPLPAPVAPPPTSNTPPPTTTAKIGLSPGRSSGQSQMILGYNSQKSTTPNLDTQKSQILDTYFPHEIEEAANSYFQHIYTSQISIDEALLFLSRCKASSNPREQNIFNCMIHNLFDEYRFFHKYPDKEIEITGILFGSLIQHQLVSYYPLALALRSVLDALRNPNSKMFKFGYLALMQFKSRLQV